MILLTTSRRPTERIRTLCRELAHVIPNAVRVNRGKLSLDGVAERALEFGADHVIIIDRWKGGPGEIQFFSRRFRRPSSRSPYTLCFWSKASKGI